MKEIKADAATWADVKRLSDVNERLIEIAKIAFTKSRKSREHESAWYELVKLESKAND